MGRRDGRGMRWVALLIAALVIGSEIVGGGAWAAERTAPSGGVIARGGGLDLAAVVPRPADVAAVGYAGMGMLSSAALDVEATAAYEAGQPGEAATTAARLREHGFEQGYESTLARPSEPGRSDVIADVVLSTYVTVFAEPSGAAAELGRQIDVAWHRLPSPIGDEAWAKPFSTYIEDLKLTVRGFDVSFRDQEVVVGLAMLSSEAAGVPESTVVALAAVAAERLATARAGDHPSLNAQTLRFAGAGLGAVRWEWYQILNGDVAGRYGVTAEALTEDAEYVATRGLTDSFSAARFLTPASDVMYSTTVDRYGTVEAATAAFARMTDPTRDRSEFEDYRVLSDFPALGDESQAVSFFYGTGQYHRPWLRLMVRVGDRIAEISLGAADAEAISLSALETMGRAQVACFENGGCAGPIPSPLEPRKPGVPEPVAGLPVDAPAWGWSLVGPEDQPPA